MVFSDVPASEPLTPALAVTARAAGVEGGQIRQVRIAVLQDTSPGGLREALAGLSLRFHQQIPVAGGVGVDGPGTAARFGAHGLHTRPLLSGGDPLVLLGHPGRLAVRAAGGLVDRLLLLQVDVQVRLAEQFERLRERVGQNRPRADPLLVVGNRKFLGRCKLQPLRRRVEAATDRNAGRYKSSMFRVVLIIRSITSSPTDSPIKIWAI
jgi:hypothetical protein